MSYNDSRQHALPVNLFPILCCPLVNLSGTKPVLLPAIQNLKRLWWCVKDDKLTISSLLRHVILAIVLAILFFNLFFFT